VCVSGSAVYWAEAGVGVRARPLAIVAEGASARTVAGADDRGSGSEEDESSEAAETTRVVLGWPAVVIPVGGGGGGLNTSCIAIAVW
jgi:hypothetical protein